MMFFFLKRQIWTDSRGYVELLHKMWDCAKELQLRTEELNNEVLLSKEKSGQTTWLLAARSGKVKVLKKLWHWARTLQLKPEGLMKEVLMSKDRSGKRPFSWQQEVATLNY